ncbi:DUF6134 family protein [Caulobacter sp. S45]|uniref:DUF6134 family protein n=1 Tax=Caulobacter sp. S45 TaxID=1641861 RepID=UPI00131A923B|nr:DUF6134 family protein [Caulobacter sp. S45]
MGELLRTTRRGLLGAGLCVLTPAWALAQSNGTGATGMTGRRLSFDIWRNRQNIGRHTVEFRGGDQDLVVAVEALMLVKLGPIPVFHYHHQATETWRGGRFARLETSTVANGKHDQVTAIRTASGVSISTGAGRTVTASADTHPLTHWNAAVLEAPLFNPQTGALIHERVSRSDGHVELADGRAVAATRYALDGDAELVDWYDAQGVWTALRGKAPDGSYLEYRRSA